MPQNKLLVKCVSVVTYRNSVFVGRKFESGTELYKLVISCPFFVFELRARNYLQT